MTISHRTGSQCGAAIPSVAVSPLPSAWTWKAEPVTEPDDRETRWEYQIIWRYGALLLLAVGLLAMGFGASGLCTTAISVVLLPIGFVCLVAGVVLPRIEGKLTVSPSQISADILGVRTLDQLSVTTSAPAVVLREVQTRDGLVAIETAQPPGAITLGDVWDALDAAGAYPKSGTEVLNNQAVFEGVGLGSAYFRLADDRMLKMPNRGFLDYAAASPELLAVLATWEIRPIASGRYPVPSEEARWVAAQPPVFFLPPRPETKD